MTVTVYKSTDTSAPVLNGTNGSMITVLDAILVNGYGAKPAAGWTKPFTGTNQAAYRMNSVSGIGHYVQINDNSPNSTAVGREARARAFEVMTSATAGTGPYPTTTQVADTAGPMIRKSATQDATARPWICVADERTFYFFNQSGDNGGGWSGYCFGEFYSLRAADAYRGVCIGRPASGGAVAAGDAGEVLDVLSALSAVASGHYTARGIASDVVGAVQLGKHGNAAHSVALLVGLAPYPNPYDNGLLLSQVWLHQDMGSLGAPLGRLRGFWHFLHPMAAAVNDGDTFSGSGPLAGKTFLVIKPNIAHTAMYVIETSNTWETN